MIRTLQDYKETKTHIQCYWESTLPQSIGGVLFWLGLNKTIVKQISIFNNMVDNNSRNYLNYFDLENDYLEPVYFKSVPFDKNQYLNLIKRKGNYYE